MVKKYRFQLDQVCQDLDDRVRFHVDQGPDGLSLARMMLAALGSRSAGVIIDPAVKSGFRNFCPQIPRRTFCSVSLTLSKPAC